MMGANVMLIGGQTSATPDRLFSAEKWTVSHHGKFDVESARWADILGGTSLAQNFEGIGYQGFDSFSTSKSKSPV